MKKQPSGYIKVTEQEYRIFESQINKIEKEIGEIKEKLEKIEDAILKLKFFENQLKKAFNYRIKENLK